MHKKETMDSESVIEDYEHDLYMVPLVDEEEKSAKKINEYRKKNSVNDNIIPPSISNEIGFDYVKEEEFAVKKRKISQNEMFQLFRSLNPRQKNFFMR